MDLSLEGMKIDMGTTPVENMFVESYFAMATGDAIKVYLYCYKLAYENSDRNISNKMLAQELAMTEEDVEGQIEYWISEGLIRKEEGKLVFRSLRQMYLENTGKVEEKEDLYESRIQKMYGDIEDVLGVDLTPSEIVRIREFLHENDFEPELMAQTFKFSDEKYGKKNLNYVLGIARNWALDGIRTLEGYRAYQEREKKRKEGKKSLSSGKKAQIISHNSSDEDFEALLKKKALLNRKNRRGGENGE